MGYAEEYRDALADPVTFWSERGRDLPWFERPSKVLEQDTNGVWRWFVDGQINSCHVALDQHVEAGRGEATALIYDSPVTQTMQKFTFSELTDRVAKLAGAMANLGVSKGDVVVLYMPMIPEAVIGMLACARLGAVHSVVFGGFAPRELALRIDDATPKLILSASCGIEGDKIIDYTPLLLEALALAQQAPQAVVVKERQQSPVDWDAAGFIAWDDCVAAAQPVPCTPMLATDPLYILYTSGTTGKPKGIVRDNGGHAVALTYSMRAIYNVGPGDVFWAASDVGWVVGHSYIVYGPLFAGCTTILYEGKPVKTPDAGAFWRVLAEHRVKSFFVAPTAFRAIRKEDPNGDLLSQYDLSALQYQFVAGERLDPATYFWLQEKLDVPVIDHWWQTETGWSICTNLAGVELLETKAGSCSLPAPGWDLRIFDEAGQEVGPGVEGAIVVKAPLPPGAMPTVWRDHQRYEASYWSDYPGFYLTGDSGLRDTDGYVFVMGRTDDVMNVAGHRLSTGQIEEVVSNHASIAECAVVGRTDAEKGQVPVGLIVVKDGVEIASSAQRDALAVELVAMVRAQVGAFANFRQVFVVARLPKTRSGKILRKVIRGMLDGAAVSVPSTIEDATVLDELADNFSGS